jgi:hypothetical protein
LTPSRGRKSNGDSSDQLKRAPQAYNNRALIKTIFWRAVFTLRSLEKNLCELCAFAPLRLCEKSVHVVWFLAKAQRRKVRKGSCGNLRSFTMAETMIKDEKPIEENSG